MAGHGCKLPRKQERLIAELLTQPTVTAAATAAGVSESTARIWMKRPAFRDAYRQAREAVLERVVARLLAVSDKAVAAIESCLDSNKPAVRLRAALGAIDRALRGADTLDLAEELRQLRGEMEGLKHAHAHHAARNGTAPRHASGTDGGAAAAGAAPGGPGGADASGGDDAGRVAATDPLFDGLTDPDGVL
jgi:hypothetical protein